MNNNPILPPKRGDSQPQEKKLTPAEAFNLYSCCDEYYRAFVLLREYDEQDNTDIVLPDTGEEYIIKAQKANLIIWHLKTYLSEEGEHVENFGIARGDGIERIIGSIYQTGGCEEVYPDLESKATHLFYFLIKDHLFIDGNKRIATFLLLWFMDMNDMLFLGRKDRTLAYNTVYALAVFVAESSPKDKEIVVKLIHSFVGSHHQALPE